MWLNTSVPKMRAALPKTLLSTSKNIRTLEILLTRIQQWAPKESGNQDRSSRWSIKTTRRSSHRWIPIYISLCLFSKQRYSLECHSRSTKAQRKYPIRRLAFNKVHEGKTKLHFKMLCKRQTWGLSLRGRHRLKEFLKTEMRTFKGTGPHKILRGQETTSTRKLKIQW